MDGLGDRLLDAALQDFDKFFRVVVARLVAMFAGLRRKLRMRLDMRAGNVSAGAAIRIELGQKIMDLFDAVLVGLGMPCADFGKRLRQR